MHAAAAISVENCTFLGDENMTDPFEMVAGTAFYSDSSVTEVKNWNSLDPPTPLESIPPPEDSTRLSFLARSDRWFAELRNVRP
jgi:hypothetical protein